jgi:hypothetical protein
MRRLGTSWRVSDLALIVYQVAAIMRSLYPRVLHKPISGDAEVPSVASQGEAVPLIRMQPGHRVREGHEISQGDE